MRRRERGRSFRDAHGRADGSLGRGEFPLDVPEHTASCFRRSDEEVHFSAKIPGRMYAHAFLRSAEDRGRSRVRYPSGSVETSRLCACGADAAASDVGEVRHTRTRRVSMRPRSRILITCLATLTGFAAAEAYVRHLDRRKPPPIEGDALPLQPSSDPRIRSENRPGASMILRYF